MYETTQSSSVDSAFHLAYEALSAPNKTSPPLFAHQKAIIDRAQETPHLFIASDPGTGKTRTCLEIIKQQSQGRVLVLAPKSILEPAWGADIRRFTPKLSYEVAYAENRLAAFSTNARIILTNHDATKWLEENKDILGSFDTLIIDESTAYKNPSAKRSKAIAKLAKHFTYRILLSGTPTPNGTLDLWHQMYLCDGGERLGKSYYAFRSTICSPEQLGRSGVTIWTEKPGALEAVSSLVDDIMIRYKLEDVIEIPANYQRTVAYDLLPKHRKVYDSFHKTKLMELHNGRITAQNAAVHVTKLLQLSSGAVYNENGEPEIVADERYDLIQSLIEERDQCVVAFNWAHQRDELTRRAGHKFGIIDGSIPVSARTRVVEAFQSGELKTIYAHPASAGHGLTLTAGTTTIWASPTFNCEQYDQFNHRIYRAGQTQKTETIHIQANQTIDETTYARLLNKHNNMQNLLELIK